MTLLPGVMKKCVVCKKHYKEVRRQKYRLCRNARCQSWFRRKNDPQWELARQLKRLGLTVESYQEMLEGQGGACGICGKLPLPDKRLHVDHCHRTNRIRGLLCRACNHLLGNAEDKPDTLRTAAHYLEAGGLWPHLELNVG